MSSYGCLALAVSLTDRFTLEINHALDHLAHSGDHIRSCEFIGHELGKGRAVVIHILNVASTKSSSPVIHRPIVRFNLQPDEYE